MIKNIYIEQFGGIRDKALSLESGLNVILGDNETGKSSFMQALFFLLFQKTKYLKTDKNFIEKALPYPEGDMAAASLILLDDQTQYEIKKQWSINQPSAFMKKGDTFTTDERGIEETIKSLLFYGEGTYSSLIFSGQNRYREIFENIQKDKDSYSTIHDLMKKLSIELSGLSVNRYREKLRDEYKLLSSRWDMKNHRPEGNRGLDNPYQKEVGKILSLYYEKERLRHKMEESEKIENNFILLSGRLTESQRLLQQFKKKLEEKEPLEENIRKYSLLKEQKSRQDQELKLYHEDYFIWPSLEAQQSSLKEKFHSLTVNLQNSNNEIEAIRTYQNIKQYEERLKQINSLEEELLNSSMANIFLRKGQIKIVDAYGDEKVLSQGEQTPLRKYGRILVGEDVEIEIQSEDINTDSLNKEKAEIKEKYQILNQSLDHIEEDQNEYNKRTSYYKDLQSAEREKTVLISEIQRVQRELDKLNFQMDLLIKKYDHKENLFTIMMDKNYQNKKIEEEYLLLQNACQGYEGDYEKFIDELKKLRIEEKEQVYKENEIRKALNELELLRSDVSVEEMDRQLQELEHQFETEVDKATKIFRIMEIFEDTCKDLEKYSESTLTSEFSKNLSYITDGKYDKIEMKDIKRLTLGNNQKNLSVNILSEGTFESVTLSFRLAALNQLMDGKKGFIILDDCLLNMDAQRRKRSADLIIEYSSKYQILFTTCSKEISDLFTGQGHQIKL